MIEAAQELTSCVSASAAIMTATQGTNRFECVLRMLGWSHTGLITRDARTENNDDFLEA